LAEGEEIVLDGARAIETPAVGGYALGELDLDGSFGRKVCFYEKVYVLRKAGLGVKDDRVAADNQVSNAMGMEG